MIDPLRLMPAVPRTAGIVAGVLAVLYGLNAQLLGAQTETAAVTCGSTHRQWMQRALDAWAMVARNALELPVDSLPWIVLFDARCAWHLAPRGPSEGRAQDITAEAMLRFGGRPVPVRRIAHGDSIRVPSGRVVPPRPAAFASLYRGDSASFLVMALPVLCRTTDETPDPALDEFFLGVFAHEMVHTRQLAAISRHVQALGRRWRLPANLDDDVVQHQFDTVPGFRQSVDNEIDLLFRAAVASDSVSRRRLAAQALRSAEIRRAKYFIADRAVYAPLEDVFLLMEGLGSWAAYRVALAHAPPASTRDSVVAALRRNRSWSQTLGLGVFLVLDAVFPDWQSRVFAEEPVSPFDLLREALRPADTSWRGANRWDGRYGRR